MSTPEQLAKQILSVSIKHFKCRPGFTIQKSSYLPIMSDLGVRNDEFNRGIEYALSQGWVEEVENGKLYRITGIGFSKV